MPAREEADRLPPPLPSAGRFSMVVTTWFGGAGGGGGCSWGCGGSGGIIAAEAVAGGYQKAAGHIVRGLRARGTRREPGQAAPAREAVPPAKRRSGEAPAAPAAASQRSAFGLLPSPGCTPSLGGRRFLQSGLFPSRDPSPGTPRQVAAKGSRREPGATVSTARTKDRAERGTRLPGFAFCPSAQGLSWRWQLRWRCFSWCRVRSESCRLCLTE